MANITFAITENIAVIAKGTKGWQREVNMISWNGADPKIDIRDWAPDHEKMGKGITLTKDEAERLVSLLGNYLGDDPAPTTPEPAPAPAAPAAEGGTPYTAEQLAMIEAAKKLLQGGN